MPEISREVVVIAPLRMVYDAWTQFESYPQFLEGVEDVSLVDAKQLHWRARSGDGDAREWDVRIVELAPDDRILWEASGGPVRSGAVHLNAVAEGKTRVRMEMNLENAGDDEPEIAQRAERDLQCFKDYIEERAAQTSGWQAGSTNSDAPSPPPSAPPQP